MKKYIYTMIGLLMIGTISQAEPLWQEADASNMAFVQTSGHSHASVAWDLNQLCEKEFVAFNKRDNGKVARDYHVDITSLIVIEQKASYGEAICFFSKVIEG